MTHNYQSIAVLMGGWSNEREVSLQSATDVLKAFGATNYRVTAIDVTHDLRAFLDALNQAQPDVVINALHGTGGEDGVIQGVLNMLQIPYTHSGVLASALAMDKILSRMVLAQNGIPVPTYKSIPVEEYKNGTHPFTLPYIIKPLAEGSSRGLALIKSDADRDTAMADWAYGNTVLCEVYIPGREINVAVINGKAIGAIELKPHSGIYDYEAKYTEGKTVHVMPAPLDPADEALMYRYAEMAHQILGCKGVTRTDFRFDESTDAKQRMAVLEVNTQPGLTPLSLVPEIAAYVGISFLDLLENMLTSATWEK